MREMLLEIIRCAEAHDKKGLEKAFRLLERVGMDRYTAKIAAKELYKELKAGEKNV